MDPSQALSYSFWKLDFAMPFASDMQNCLYRWGLLESLKVLKFRFNLEFQITSAKQFLESLMAVKAVQGLIGVSYESIRNVEFVVKKCSLLNTNFLDRFEEHNIMDSDGYLRQIMPIYQGDFEVNTKLSQILSKLEVEDEQLLHLFDDVRDEFLFSLFRVLVLGGKFNQLDDSIDSYREITKQMYKGLVK